MKNQHTHHINNDAPFKQDRFFKKNPKSRYQIFDEEWDGEDGKSNFRDIAETLRNTRHKKIEIEDE